MSRMVFSRNTQLVFLLPTFAIIFNCLLGFFPRQSGLALIKGLFFISLLVYLYIGQFQKSLNKFHLVFLLILYWFILLPFSTGQERSLEYILKNGISILMLPLGYCYINTPQKFMRFVYIQLNLLIVFVCFAILSNIFKWGVNQYGGAGGVRVGLYDAQLYGPAVVLTLVPFILQSHNFTKFNKYKIFFLGFATVLLLLLSMRRTSILIILAGLVIFYVNLGKVKNLILILAGMSFVLLLTFPLYGDYLMERMELRSNVFTSEYEVTDELRYQELYFVLKDLNENFSFGTLIFGKEIFNSPGHYGFTDGFLARRELHVDYTKFFHGTGLFGLFLYLVMLFQVLKLFVKRYKKYRLIFPMFAKTVRAVFYVAFILLLLIHFSGQMEELNFRSVLFLTLGGALGVIYNSRPKSSIVQSKFQSRNKFVNKTIDLQPIQPTT